MYSLTRSSMASHEARMQSGIRNVVRITNSIEIPSMPILYLIGPSQLRSSTNWKPDVAGSKLIQMRSEITNVMRLVQRAV